jgi:hypothetical protein
MKKVRVALATAVPAAGMLVVPGTVANAAPARVANALCIASKTATHASGRGEFFVFASYSNYSHCVIFQQGTLTHRQSGLQERVRIYNAANVRVYQAYLGGTQYAFSTKWWNSPYQSHAYNLWGALVKNNTNSVVYGPVGIPI